MQQIFISSFCLFSLIMTFFKVTVACTEVSCGFNGLAIDLPFRRGDDEHRIVLGKFLVKHIDYIRQEIQLSTPDCLLLTSLDNSYMDLPSSPFYADETVNLTLFRCPVQRVVDNARLVPCLGNYAAYAVESFASPGDYPALESCTKMYDLSLLHGNDYAASSEPRLRWYKPNCSECKAMGNKCRLKNNGIQSEIECVHPRKPNPYYFSKKKIDEEDNDD